MPNGRDLNMQVTGSTGADIEMEVQTGGQGSASNAEAWAVGERHGVPVNETDETYHNNSKYHAQQSANSAEASAHSAEESDESAEDSEAYAIGTRDGTAVDSEDPAYHNNSKYFSEQASENAEEWAVGERGGVPVGSTSDAYHNNAKYHAQQASENAEEWAVGERGGVPVDNTSDAYQNNAKHHADRAADRMRDAQAWAEGRRGETGVASDDETYHNNAKYHAEQAAGSATAAQAAQQAAEIAQSHYPKVEYGTWWVWNNTTNAWQDTHVQATGEWRIMKTYATIAAMEADYSTVDVKNGEFVMVVSNVEDPDNAKLYVKGAQQYQFIVDMSGATGIQGPAAYIHVRYSTLQPTQDSDMKTEPDDWLGVYAGTSVTAPTAYTSYQWQKVRGDIGPKGDTGAHGVNNFIHIKWSGRDPQQDSDMKDVPDDWMGVYYGESETAPTEYTSYQWQNVKGKDGTGVYYANTTEMSIEDNRTVAEVLAGILNRTQALEGSAATHVVSGEVENGVAYFYNEDGEELFNITGIGGGGGGGGGSTAVFSFASSDGTYARTISSGSTLTLSMTWSSIEDETPTGSGTLKLTVGGVVRFTKTVNQGTITEDVTKYLSAGENSLRFSLTDANGTTRNRTFSVTVVSLNITSNFDSSGIFDGDIVFPYVAYGDLEKTVHFLVDNTEVATDTFTSFGRQRTKTLSALSHGAHRLVVYYTATVNSESVSSNRLVYDLICVVSGNNTPIISTDYTETSVSQYSTVLIPWYVYMPNSQVSDVTIAVNGTTVSELTGVDRTQQMFSCRLDTAGSNTISFTSGNTIRIITLTVTEVTVDATAETEGLKLYLSSYGRSNNEANPAVWTYGSGNNQIAASFSNFNWITDGWQLDEQGNTVMRVSGDARITIPYKPFLTDKRSTGFTVEIDFATRDVRNYDSTILSCLNGGRGLKLTSQSFELTSEGSGISMQFKENEHVRVAFVVEKQTAMRCIYCYINGIMSGVVRYSTTDNFAQPSAQNISIGSDDSTIDIYTIRFYDYDLPMKHVEENWIADTPNGAEMVERYVRNNIRDQSDKIVINKLPVDLPYLVVECAELPQYKGDKKTCSGYYVDQVNPEKSFTFTEAQIDVQGTSSQYYERKNYKVKFNGGFVMPDSTTASKYKMRQDSIAVKTFCFKADVASSEGANNVELVRLYDSACPYKTPAQQANSKVRQGIDGFPIVIFWHDTENDTISFLGKYNFNNDKSNEDVFGFTEGDESWEIRNNTSDRVLWKNADYTGDDWLNDFEARYPDTDPAYEDPAQLAEFAAWMVSCDPAQATNDALAESVTFTDNGTSTTYTTDSAAYRKAKFKAELGDYVEIQSALFYYLFTEMFLMVDSRAKNMFPSFMGTDLTEGGNE